MFRLAPRPSDPPVQRTLRNKNDQNKVDCSPACSVEIYLHLLTILDGIGTTLDLSCEDTDETYFVVDSDFFS
jgi:hypothetical protein